MLLKKWPALVKWEYFLLYLERRPQPSVTQASNNGSEPRGPGTERCPQVAEMHKWKEWVQWAQMLASSHREEPNPCDSWFSLINKRIFMFRLSTSGTNPHITWPFPGRSLEQFPATLRGGSQAWKFQKFPPNKTTLCFQVVTIFSRHLFPSSFNSFNLPFSF